MTISSETRKAGPFPGNGATTAFSFAFKVFTKADISVTLTILATGVQALLTLDADYTVALNPDQNANPGGTVTYNPSGVPMPATKTLTIGSVVARTQGTDITNGGAFLPNIIEDMVDRTTIEIQQEAEKVTRSLKFPIVDGVLTSELPAAAQRANKLLSFDADGNVTATAAAAGSATELQILLADTADVANGATLIGYLGGTLRAYLNQFVTSVGASIIGWIQSGTGAVLRTIQAKLRESVSVKDFGAVGDGVTDDSAAFQAAATASGVLYVPPGIYILNTGITFTSKSVMLFGAGRELTELRFGTVAIGITVENALVFSPVEIRDMSITTTQTLAGTAIDITWPDTFDGRLIHKGTLSGLQIQGANNQTQGWNKGIRYTQGCFVTITDCGILGRDTDGNTDLSQAKKSASQIGIEWVGGTYPVDIRVQNCFINCWDRGFDASGAPEGLDFHNCSFLYCRVGIKAAPTVFSAGLGGGSAMSRPLLRVSDCHFACYISCVDSNGMVQSIIHDNLFYTNNLGASAANAVYIQNSGDILIHDNEFYQFATVQTVNHCVIETSTDIIIHDNIFGASGTGIWLKAGVSNCYHRKNKFTGPYTTADILDSGTNNVAGPRGFLVSRTAALAIPNNVATTVAWDATDYNLGAFTIAAGGVITLPTGVGVRRVKVSASIAFAGNATGFRDANILKNGAFVYPGCSGGSTSVVGASGETVYIQTAIITVASGDTFALQVFQNSGGALNVGGSGTTWLSLEVID